MPLTSSQNGFSANAWAVRMADTVLQSYPASKWKWHYEHGLVVKAIADVYAATGDTRFRGFDKRWVDHFVDSRGQIRTYKVDEFNLDQINPGRLLFPLYRANGNTRYDTAIHILMNQLQNQMRTASGGFWHKRIYPYQMWLDGLYMAEPFYAEYAQTFNKPELFEDITHQFVLIERQTRDPQTGLLYHAWDESKTQRWANPETGCSNHFWGRSIGWYVMALVDVLDFLPADHPQRQSLIEILGRLAYALIRYQDPATGLWYQVVDLVDRPGNYLETSVSAMLAYGFAKAVRKEYLAAEYLSAARRAYHGLLQNKIRVEASGLLTLGGICTVGGLGGSPYRDGSFGYYMSEPVAANDFKGVGPFILAALELENTGPESSNPPEKLASQS